MYRLGPPLLVVHNTIRDVTAAYLPGAARSQTGVDRSAACCTVPCRARRGHNPHSLTLLLSDAGTLCPDRVPHLRLSGVPHVPLMMIAGGRFTWWSPGPAPLHASTPSGARPGTTAVVAVAPSHLTQLLLTFDDDCSVLAALVLVGGCHGSFLATTGDPSVRVRHGDSAAPGLFERTPSGAGSARGGPVAACGQRPSDHCWPCAQKRSTYKKGMHKHVPVPAAAPTGATGTGTNVRWHHTAARAKGLTGSWRPGTGARVRYVAGRGRGGQGRVGCLGVGWDAVGGLAAMDDTILACLWLGLTDCRDRTCPVDSSLGR